MSFKLPTAALIGMMAFSSLCLNAQADEAVTIKVTSMSNVSGNGAIEACGTAVHKDGVKPLAVTVMHGPSNYTVLTDPSGRWCVVVKRKTYGGKIDVTAVPLSGN